LTDASVKEHLLGAIIGFIAYLEIYFLARLLYRKEAFGFGDVFLMGSIVLRAEIRDAWFNGLFSFKLSSVWQKV